MNPVDILQDTTSTPIALARAVAHEVGKEWTTWEPSALWAEVKDSTGVDLTREHKDAIMALRICNNTNAPWFGWRPFLAVINALNGDSLDAQEITPVTLSNLVYGVDLMLRIKPSAVFSDEVKAMIGISLWSNGVCWVPDHPLGSLANSYLLARQREPEQQELVSLLAKDYLYDDNLDAMDDVDTVRMHTIKLKSLDIYVTMKRKREGF